jgi:hypothetical protein
VVHCTEPEPAEQPVVNGGSGALATEDETMAPQPGRKQDKKKKKESKRSVSFDLDEDEVSNGQAGLLLSTPGIG